MVVKEGEESYTTNLCQQCYNESLVARRDEPLTKWQGCKFLALQQFLDGRPRLVGLGGEKHTHWWCAICGEKYDWKQPNRLLVVQTGESVNQAKVLKAHAVPQGLCGNLINALKLLANQQNDGDVLIQNIVTNFCEVSQEGSHGGFEKLHSS